MAAAAQPLGVGTAATAAAPAEEEALSAIVATRLPGRACGAASPPAAGGPGNLVTTNSTEDGGHGRTMQPGRREEATSLNSDPFNLRAEELALQECTLGVEVRRTWSETEMVRSFGGQVTPGTPDGMFEDWSGALTCVQVVRVPLAACFDAQRMEQTLAQTLLTKVVKSQQWLSFTRAMPRDFVIFCWLPFVVPDRVADAAEVLMERIRRLDARFSLRLRVPAAPGTLFPALFASNHDRIRKCRSFTESDVSSYEETEAGDVAEEDTPPDWDITWAWDDCLAEEAPEAAEPATVAAAEAGAPEAEPAFAKLTPECSDEFLLEPIWSWDDGG